MKYKLMIQSMSPLALLTIIKNFSFVLRNEDSEYLSFVELIKVNLPLIVVMSICVIWIILSLIFWVSINVFKYSDRKGAYSISNITQNKNDGLDFFLTLILPLLIDDLNTWQGCILFIAILIVICFLLVKTDSFYANPVLLFLGYCVFEFEFEENGDKPDYKYKGISFGEIKGDYNIEYKEITTNVLFVKEIKNDGRY